MHQVTRRVICGTGPLTVLPIGVWVKTWRHILNGWSYYFGILAVFLGVISQTVVLANASPLMVVLEVCVCGWHPQLVSEIGKDALRIVSERHGWHVFVRVPQMLVEVVAFKARTSLEALGCICGRRELLGGAGMHLAGVVGFLLESTQVKSFAACGTTTFLTDHLQELQI